jgi:hypothetical protein
MLFFRYVIQLYAATAIRQWPMQGTLGETKLTSAAILSRIIADTAGVDKRVSCPTQTRLTPLAAAIFVMIYNKICQISKHSSLKNNDVLT